MRVEYENGNLFEGYYMDGKKSGLGKMIYNNLKAANEGPDDVNDTKLMLTNKSTAKSKKQVKHLLSENMTENGEYYGNWKRDMREGEGRMKWGDGSRFEGTWF